VNKLILSLVLACAASFPASSNAYDVIGLEKAIANKNSSDNIERRIASLALSGYYAGLSEAANFLIGADNVIWMWGQKKICLPANDLINQTFVAAIVESEIKRDDHYSQALGKDWKTYYAGNFFFFGLARTFPCR